MAANPTRQVTVEELAERANLSPFHFLRSFQERFQETPHQYLIRLRLEFAQRLLQETDRSVTDICLEVGFSSLGSFSKNFKRRLGRSPSAYRRHVREVKRNPYRFVPGCVLMHCEAIRAQNSNFGEAAEDDDMLDSAL